MKKVWAAALLSMCVACQVEAPAHVTLDLTEWQLQSALTQVGTLTLRVSAPDIRTQTFVVPVSSDPNASQLAVDLPSGPARVFEISATGSDGMVLYWGSKTVDLPSAASISVTLPAFTAGVLQGTVQAANGAAVPSGTSLTAQALSPRPDAPAAIKVAVDNGRVSQAMPTGDYVLVGQVTAGGVPYAVSQPVSIYAGQITPLRLTLGSLPGVALLAFTTQPVSGVAGVAQPVVVQVRDTAQHVITNANVPVTLQLLPSVGGQSAQQMGLQGNITVMAQNGVATFSNLRVTQVGTFQLRASAANVVSGTSDLFTITVGALAGFAPPYNGVATGPGSLPINAVDAFGNLVPDYAGVVSATSGQTTLQPVTMAGGTGFLSVNFTTLGAQTVVLSDGKVTSTITLTVVPGEPASVEFLTQPADSNICTPFPKPVQLAVRDAYGYVVTGPQRWGIVTLTLDPNTPGHLRGQTQVVYSNTGIATFTDLNLPQEGNYTLQASVDPRFGSIGDLLSNPTGPLTATSNTVHISNVQPAVSNLSSNGTAGAIVVTYTLTDACSRPADLQVHTSGGGQPAINAVSPLNSRLPGTEGLVQLRTSPTGVTHTLAWESWQDVGRRNVDGLSLNFTAVAGGAYSQVASLDNLTVNNALSSASLEPSLAVRSPVPNVVQLATVDWDRSGTADIISLSGDKLLLGLVSPAGDAITQVGPFAAGTGAQAFAVADVNHDGFQDVVVGNGSGASLLLGTAATSLGVATPLSGGKGVAALALADFNRDGFVDLVSTDGTTAVQTRLYSGTAFGAASTLTDITPTRIEQLAVVDLDLDGFTDIVALDVASTVNVERNDGQGGFTHNTLSVDGNAVAMAVADVTGDGLPDVVVGSDTGAVYFALNTGGAGFNSFTNVNSPLQTAAAQMVPGDFDADGLLDVAVLDAQGGLSFLNGSGYQPFFANFTHPVGGLHTLAAADVNRDTRTDLLVADASQLGVLRNVQPIVPALPPQPHFAPLPASPNDDIALGELTGDGRLDAVVCTQGAVLVLAGDGDGQYTLTQSLPLSGAYSPALGDVDGDGSLDLIVGTRSPAQVVLQRGVGDGTFKAPEPLALLPSTALVKLLAADLDGDLLADLVVVDNANQVEIFGAGVGGLARRQAVPAGGHVRDVALGDFNNDGLLEVVTVNFEGAGNESLTLLTAHADGTYSGASFQGSSQNDQLAVGDFDGDQVPEVVVTNHTANPNTYTWSDPNLDYTHDWQLDEPFDAVQLGPITYSGEGVDALVTNSSHMETLQYLYSATNLKCTNTLPPDTRSVRLANINGDAQLDAVAASHGSQGLVTWQAQADNPVYAEAWTTYQSDGQPTLVALVDLDINGVLDVVLLDANTSKLWSAINNGGDDFNTPNPNDIGPGAVDMAFADLDHDGYPDAVTANAGDHSLSYLQGHGALGFDLKSAPDMVATPVALALGDLNHDGWLDIVVVGTNPSSLTVGLSQQGNYTFTRVGLSAAPLAVALGDLTGDGTLDAVIASADTSVKVLPGLGDGTFGSATLTGSTAYAAGHLALADLNRDGKLDVVLAHPADSAVSWLVRQGAGFVATKIPVGPQPRRVAVSDVNGDGFPDVVTACSDASIPLVLGDGNGGLLAVPRMYLPDGPAYGVALGDLNHDARADIVVTQPGMPRFNDFLTGYRKPPLL